MLLPNPPILLITDRNQARAPLGDILERAFVAGCRWASVREKDLPNEEQAKLARELLPLARRYNATLTLHGDPDVAKDAGLDGVHLSDGSDVPQARALLGLKALIGLSVHDEEAATRAGAGLDYLIAGPVFETASKPGYGPALRPEGFARFARAIPVIAIGGIEPANAAILRSSGASGIAIMGSMMRAEDTERLMREIITAFGSVMAGLVPAIHVLSIAT